MMIQILLFVPFSKVLFLCYCIHEFRYFIQEYKYILKHVGHFASHACLKINIPYYLCFMQQVSHFLIWSCVACFDNFDRKLHL